MLILEIPFAPDANAKTYKIKLQLQNLIRQKNIFLNEICVRVAVRTKAIADISSISINPPGRVPGIFPTMTQLFNKNKNKDRSRDVPENGPAKIVNIITF